jgi:hypothetical protein
MCTGLPFLVQITDLAYDVRTLKGALPADGIEGSLFIDGSGGYCDPSYDIGDPGYPCWAQKAFADPDDRLCFRTVLGRLVAREWCVKLGATGWRRAYEVRCGFPHASARLEEPHEDRQ